jgi:hypothetical protein
MVSRHYCHCCCMKERGERYKAQYVLILVVLDYITAGKVALHRAHAASTEALRR